MKLHFIFCQFLILVAMGLLLRQAEAITFEATDGGAFASIQGYQLESNNVHGLDSLGPFYANDPGGTSSAMEGSLSSIDGCAVKEPATSLTGRI